MSFFKKTLSSLVSIYLLLCLSVFNVGCKTETTPDEPKEYLPVSDLTATAKYKQAVLTWTNPEDDELSSIEIKYGTNANKPSEKKVCNKSETTCTISDLENGTKYYFTVYAIYSDANNTKKSSATKTIETPNPEAVKNLKAESTGTDSIKLTWVNQTEDFYKSNKILYGTDSNKLDKTIKIESFKTAATEVKELSPETKYYFQVVTTLSDDETISSAKVNATTDKEEVPETENPPTENNPSNEDDNGDEEPKNYNAVTKLTATPGYKQISLSWTNPTDSDLSAIEVKYGTSASSLSEKKELTKTENSVVLSNLSNNTVYYYSITAIYSDANSTKKSTNTLNAKTLNPVAISNLKVTATGTTTIKISWENQTGNFYKSKNIKYGTSENNLSNSIQINDNSTTSATLENLSVYTKYYIQVETVLSDDDKIISTTINKTTRNTSTSTDDLVNISSVDFAKKLTIGWNLGNTLDAYTENTYKAGQEGLNIETAWGMPYTTQDMIKEVHSAGFETIRIPVSWHNHISPSDSNYTIDEDWMNRVKEIVDWAIDDGMFVILNIHHDNLTINDINSYPGFSLSPNAAIQAKSKSFISNVWKQIATEFASYDNHLIFEVLNEPRDIGGIWTGNEWDCDTKEVIDCITDYEQTGLNTIRSVTGNENRFIMTGGYAASGTNLDMLYIYKMPADSATDKLLLSTHAYSPYNFAMYSKEDASHTKFTDEDKTSLDTIFAYLKKNYTAKGIGVVMGEASSSDKNNLSERENWATYYFTKAAEAGIPVVLWDNQVTLSNGGQLISGECHGYLNRKNLSWYFPTLISKMMEAAQTETDLSNIIDYGLLDSPLNMLNWNGSVKLSKNRFENATSSSSLKFTITQADGASTNSGTLRIIDQWGDSCITFCDKTITTPETFILKPTTEQWEQIKTTGIIIYGTDLKITYIELQ